MSLLCVSSELLFNFFLIDLNWGTLQKLVSGMKIKPLLITATDGNHGYALAFAAKLLGCEAIIFMPKVFKIFGDIGSPRNLQCLVQNDFYQMRRLPIPRTITVIHKICEN